MTVNSVSPDKRKFRVTSMRSGSMFVKSEFGKTAFPSTFILKIKTVWRSDYLYFLALAC